MKLFITGIGTDVGKTIASTIITEALEADYWKPVQAGELDFSDKDKVQSLISNSKTKIHENSYALQTPASPHYAAALDGISIDIKKITEPTTKNHLVIEGAGGIFVPLNQTETVMDLIQPDYKVIIVSRHYLGSINHTLLTIEALQNRKISIAGIIFSGDENEATESIILSKTGVTFLGRIDNEPYFDQNVISYYAEKFKENLQNLV
ncbi:MAG TPA: dethiobiotin synthase [Flavobacterium sp.]|uniref:dethiobiotin synthase n=1 Tax=unclassified Flavobacterium TaxID=196869 RepID=UPI000E87ACCE|nr:MULTISPECIES: dethiobiotin synthase [unclassified Flavobacterium]HBI00753.1 dethiobiotin synthase [Flavobacterium sp.]HRE79364.1 dethiobiotin synthase [Flavobacterium sp.]